MASYLSLENPLLKTEHFGLSSGALQSSTRISTIDNNKLKKKTKDHAKAKLESKKKDSNVNIRQSNLLSNLSQQSLLLNSSLFSSKVQSPLVSSKPIRGTSLMSTKLSGNVALSLRNPLLEGNSSFLLNGNKDNTYTSRLLQEPSLTSNLSNVSTGKLLHHKYHNSVEEKKSNKLKTKQKVAHSKIALASASDFKVPAYNSLKKTLLDNDAENLKIIFPAKRVNKNSFVEKTDSSIMLQKARDKINDKKVALVNLVSVALLKSPNLESALDETRKTLMKLVKEMATLDPEFILKLALYTRRHLNVRVVANFLLAYSAFLSETRPFLKKYFSQSIMLPTDWVTVAELYQTFFDKSISSSSLPTALRNAMVAKFPDFDEYQLGKYNRQKPKTNVVYYEFCDPNENDDGDDSDGEKEMYKARTMESFTMKKLIRKLHICEPVYHVMCIIGKNYPEDLQSFYKSRLPGMFDETKSGKRMKLATPETWETQVSSKGNKATTWQELLDHKKLPFMAMLRNLRNMIIAGIAPKYHSMVIKRLTDEKSVINSKQFPFRFLSAYEVIDGMEDLLVDGGYEKDCYASTVTKFNKQSRRGRPAPMPTKKRGKPVVVSRVFTKDILNRYKKALDAALRISTTHNISPIAGTTLILIQYDPVCDDSPCGSLKSFSKQKTTIEMCLLLGLMCKFHCEDGIMMLLDVQSDRYLEMGDLFEDNFSMANIRLLREKIEDLSNGEQYIRHYLNTFLAERKKIDNILILGGNSGTAYMDSFMRAYRKEVNPKCLRVSVMVSGYGVTGLNGDHDVQVCGFSDQVLQYVAERGNGKQLASIENIDVAYGLQDILVKGKKRVQFVAPIRSVERPVMPWKTVRVFISSTFRDMHGERDLLTRYVFPELRCWCYNYCLNVYEVDLRWGITESQSQSAQTVEICLNEVKQADLFIGILGERYGWIPDNYDVSDPTGLEWLKAVKPGCSITELEMRGFYEKEKAMFSSKSLFYFRGDSFMSDIPKDFVKDFACESKANKGKLEDLKFWVRRTGAEVYQNYPCRWGGVVGNKPIVAGLEDFGQRVLNNTWTAIKRNFLSAKSDPSSEKEDSTTEEIDEHYEFARKMSESFIGRKDLLDGVSKQLEEAKNKEGRNLLLIVGKSGSGKTAFMSKLIKECREHTSAIMCCYLVDAASGTKSLISLVQHILQRLNDLFSAGYSIPETYSELKVKLEELMKYISKHLGGERCIIFVEGLDQVDVGVQSSLTDWIPKVIPKHILLVVSCGENTACHKMLSAHKQLIDDVRIGALALADRATFVRQILSNYGKVLDETPFNNQMKLLLSKKESAYPLYLKLACEELRIFGVYEKFSQHIQKLAPTVPQLIEFYLKRIEMENGEDLVRDTLMLFYFSRQGLNRNELFDTLNMLHNFKTITMETVSKVGYTAFHDSSFSQQSIPQSYFLKLFRSIKLCLTPEDVKGCMKLTYIDIMKIVERRYINKDSAYVSKVHVALAGFYKKQADPGNDFQWNGKDMKALSELPYHLALSGMLWENLHSVLTSINFIRAKVEGNMCTQLLEDFQADTYSHSRSIQIERKKILNHPDVKETKDFISRNIHIFSKYPLLLKQQAVNAPDGSYIQKCSKNFSAEELQNVIGWLNNPSESSKCLLTITQQQPILCISLSRDESMIACGTADGQLILYDKNTTKELKAFIGHGSSITSCCFAGTNKLCSASDDGRISVWDVNGGHRLHILDKHKRQVTGCQATEDGKVLISVSWDNTAKLWNITDGSLAGELSGFIHPFNCVCLNKQEKYAAIGGWDHKIIIWNILENVKSAVYKGHSSSVRALAYSPSGRHLASASLGGEILLWSTDNGTMVGQLSNASYPLTSLTYSPSGLELVAASSNTSIKVWSGSLGSSANSYNLQQENQQLDYALCVAVIKDRIAVGYNTGNIVLYSWKQKVLKKWKAHSSSVRSLSFINVSSARDPLNSTMKQLISASDDRLMKRWTIGSNVVCKSIMKGHTGAVRCVRSKEAFIVSGSEDCSLCVWPGLMFGVEDNKEVDPVAVLHSHGSVVTCCDISPCETMAISGSFDKSFIIWDLNKKTSLCAVYQAHADGLTSCSWSDVGNYVVTGSNDFMLKLWDTKVIIANKDNVEAKKEKVRFCGHSSTVNDVKYKFGCIVSACTDGSVKVWTHKGVEITTFRSHQKRINSCDIWTTYPGDASLGKQWADVVCEKTIQQKVKASKRAVMEDVFVFTASDDGTVSSYQPFKAQLINELYGHKDAVSEVLISPKQCELVTCSVDKTIKTWDYKVLSEATNLACHSGEVSCVSIKDNILAASAGYDGYVHLYRDFTSHSPQSTFMCSTAPVKGLGFLSYEYLVTGDNLGKVCVWKVASEKVACCIEMDSPVQCIAVGGESKPLVIVSCYHQFQILKWNGSELTKQLETINPAGIEQLDTFNSSITVFEYPMVSMYFIDGYASRFLSTELYDHFHCFDADVIAKKGGKFVPKVEFKGKAKSKQTELESYSCSISGTIIENKIFVYIGNSNGTVSFNRMHVTGNVIDSESKKIHDDCITGILLLDNGGVMVTSSKDCTVKVWKFPHAGGPLDDIQQVGLFHCRAPVTKMSGVGTSSIIMTGDVNGNVEFLKLNYHLQKES